jgi:hypothetical protein
MDDEWTKDRIAKCDVPLEEGAAFLNTFMTAFMRKQYDGDEDIHHSELMDFLWRSNIVPPTEGEEDGALDTPLTLAQKADFVWWLSVFHPEMLSNMIRYLIRPFIIHGKLVEQIRGWCSELGDTGCAAYPHNLPAGNWTDGMTVDQYLVGQLLSNIKLSDLSDDPAESRLQAMKLLNFLVSITSLTRETLHEYRREPKGESDARN